MLIKGDPDSGGGVLGWTDPWGSLSSSAAVWLVLRPLTTEPSVSWSTNVLCNTLSCMRTHRQRERESLHTHSLDSACIWERQKGVVWGAPGWIPAERAPHCKGVSLVVLHGKMQAPFVLVQSSIQVVVFVLFLNIVLINIHEQCYWEQRYTWLLVRWTKVNLIPACLLDFSHICEVDGFFFFFFFNPCCFSNSCQTILNPWLQCISRCVRVYFIYKYYTVYFLYIFVYINGHATVFAITVLLYYLKK